MKPVALLSIVLPLLLAGCVGSSTRRPEATVSQKPKVSLADFAGIYADRSESTKGEQRSLASVLGVYHRTPAPDSLVISISPNGELFAEAKLGLATLGRGRILSDAPLKGGRLPLSHGRADSGGFFSSGKEKYSSSLYITRDGNLALESVSTFTGTFLVFPAYGTRTSVYIWKKEGNEN